MSVRKGLRPAVAAGALLLRARLRHIAGTRWPTKRYLNMQLLKQRNALIA
jgi:hypothetical protein